MNAKKIMAALAVTGCALAGYSDVSSSNIVGYKGEGLTADDFNMIGVQFTTVDGKGIDLNKDVTYAGVSGEYWPDSDIADFIQVYVNGKGWYMFYFNLDQEKWVAEDGDTPFDEMEVFKDGAITGTTMWYNANPNADRAEALKVTFAGALQSTDSVLMPNLMDDDFNMISNPYPVAYDLNDEKAVRFTGVSGEYWPDSDIADFIQVYVNGKGWYMFYFNLDQEKWVAEDGDTPFGEMEIFANGTTSSWWFNANPNADRAEALSIEFISPLKKSAE